MEKLLEVKFAEGLTFTVSGRIDYLQRQYKERILEDDPNSDPKVEYSFGLPIEKAFVHNEGKMEEVELQGPEESKFSALPILFETRHRFRLRFDGNGKHIRNVKVKHPMAVIEEAFEYEDGVLDGTIDFINTPGMFTLRFEIEGTDGTKQTNEFRFTVVSVKMNVERDYKDIKKKIDEERPGLINSFLTKTFGDSGFSPKPNHGDKPIWYAIFESIYEFYERACRRIIDNPHRLYVPHDEWMMAERIKRWTPQLVNRYYSANEDQREHGRFRTEKIDEATDTIENRFVLHTLKELSNKLKEFAGEYEQKNGISRDCIDDIRKCASHLADLASRPFFRGVGKFTGLKQQSQVLLKKPGYAQILTAWMKLRLSLTPDGSGVDVGYRPISALYEFWTFLQLRDSIKRYFDEKGIRYNLTEDSMAGSLSELIERDSDEDFESKETLSKLEYKFALSDKTKTVIIQYQKAYGTDLSTKGDKDSFSVEYSQRPDIVMTIANSSMAYTYLFDAKYRVKEYKNKDASPREAIDDMHRYRDAILYRRGKDKLNREIIGAYVLFPGRPKKSYEYAEMKEKENIGAIPLLPSHTDELDGFLTTVFAKNSRSEHLGKSISVKGMSLVIADEIPSGDDVLIIDGGLIDEKSHKKFAAGIGNHSFVWLPKKIVDRYVAKGKLVKDVTVIIINPLQKHNVTRRLCFIGVYVGEWDRANVDTFGHTNVPEGEYYAWEY